MDNYKPFKPSFYLDKELKNLPRPPKKENFVLKNMQKKNNIKKNLFSPKKNNNQTKTKVGNVIKETVVFNVPNKGKGRSLEKKQNQNKNLYLNYFDLNQNKKRPEKKEKNSPLKKIKNNNQEIPKYNSVCVSINNNYNYNLSLGNDSNNDIKIKEKSETWQEKFNRVNKQKDNMNYLDYKQLTESEFFKNKFAKKEKEEKEKLNKSENNYNFEKKVKELNSAPPPNIQIINRKPEKKNEDNLDENLNINDEIRKAPKKKAGILGFLQAFKDLLEPISIRKKNTTKITTENNINNNNNKINVNLKVNEKKVINIPTTPKIEVNKKNEIDNNNNKYNINSVNTTPKINLYERKNIINKKDGYNNDYNYYSDSAYDSCPVPNNKSYTYSRKNIINNKIDDYKNENNILSYSQKNIFKNNENNIYIKGNDFSGHTDKRDYYYKNRTEAEQKEIGFFNIFGFGKKEKDFENLKNNNTYTKKPKKIMKSPPQIKTYTNEIKYDSYNDANTNQNNNNIFVNYLNDLNTQKEYSNKPIKQKLLEKFDDDYNEENLEENLNINAEKKIQEIKINIRQKKEKDDFNNYNRINSYQNKNKNYSAIYTNKRAYNIDDLIINPKPQNKIETCVINFNQNKTSNNIYNTPKPNYNKNKFNDNYYYTNNNYYNNNYNEEIPPNNYNTDNEIYTKPKFDLSQSQRNISHKINIDSDSDNQSTNSAYTSKPIRKKIIINKSERIFKTNKTQNNNQESDSESNSDFSDVSQESTKSVKPNTIYFKHFRSFFNKNKTGNNSSNSFLKKLFRRGDKKYETDESFNSDKSDSSINSFSIRAKISNQKLHLFKKIYNYNIPIPKNIIKGYYVSKATLKIMKLPIKKVSIYTKDYYKLIEKPRIKMNYINKKRIKIKGGINLPLLKENYYFTKKNIIIIINEKEQSFENININNENNENININEEIKINNKKYFSPHSSKDKDNNTLTLSPQFGTKREPKYNKEESPVLNPSKSARDINKIISIEIDLNNNNNIQQPSTPYRESNNNKKINQSETLYIKKKPSMKKLIEDNKCKTYIKRNNTLNEDFNMKKINAFNLDSDNMKYSKKNNKIISIDINLKNNINNVKLNNSDISNQIMAILDSKSNNIKIIVDQLLIILTNKNINNNLIRLPFMEILSNENLFAKIIIKKAIEENNQKKISFYALICQQLSFQIDEDLKTILAEECKLKFDNSLNDNYNMNDNALFGIIIFIAELINLRVIAINMGLYCYENLYKKYRMANINKYYFLDIIISLLSKIGKNFFKEKIFNGINYFIDNELLSLINNDVNLPLFLKNKIIDLIKNKKYQ